MVDPKLATKAVTAELATEPVMDMIAALRFYVTQAKLNPQPTPVVRARRRGSRDVLAARARVDAALAA